MAETRSITNQARRARALATAAAVIAAAVTTLVATPPRVHAAGPAYVGVTKGVDDADTNERIIDGVAGSPTFDYVMRIACNQAACEGVTLTDVLPGEFAGFTVTGTNIAPAGVTTATLTGCTVGGTIPDTPATCVLTTDPFDMPVASTVEVRIALSVPSTLPATWPSNGVPVRNTATVAGANIADDNPLPQADWADVRIDIPVQVGVAASKAWDRDNLQYSPGAAVEFTVGATNTSNVPAEQLTLQDPPGALAPDAAATLAPASPFQYVDFAGLCAPSTLPAGAEEVQVDLYVFDGATWSWEPGVPAATADASLTLHAVTPGDYVDVGGVRFVYTSAAGDPIAAAGVAQQCVATTQRATDRDGTTFVATPTDVVNTVSASVVPTQGDPAADEAADTLLIAPLDVVVTPSKSITPPEVPASATFTVALGARNDSNGPLAELVLHEPAPGADPFLSDDLVFDGFGGWSWPAGATGGNIVWHYTDTTSSTPIAIADGPAPSTPTPPVGAAIAGFTITYTGPIDAGAVASLDYAVATEPDMVAPDPGSVTFDNVIEVSGTNPAGTDTEQADDDVTVYYPEVGIELDKTIRPAQVTPGGTLLVELRAETAANTPLINPTEIVVTDAWDGTADTDLWAAARARTIAFTDVPAGATLTVEYATGTPPALTWTTLEAGIPAGVYTGDLVTLLGSEAAADAVVGLRFTFAHPDPGFAQGTIVKPNIVFEAADTLRGTGTPVTPAGGPATTYDNLATAIGSGQAGPITVSSDLVTDPATVGIIDFGGGPGTLIADKRWVQSNGSSDQVLPLPSQSAAPAFTRHTWGVTVPGYDTVVLSDALPGQEGDPADTVFQAFDLRSIAPSTFASDPLLRWDTVSTVELYIGGVWTAVPAPGGTWMSATGFKGYTLTATQSADTTGLRITVVENTAARTASVDPARPEPGSGVASGVAGRPLLLTWQLRNSLRAPAAGWVTADVTYNSTPGVVRNDFRVAATTDATTFTRDESDDITLVDMEPGVATAKTASPTSIVVPHPGDVPDAGFPTVDFTVRAWNTASSRASYLRVADPIPCATSAGCVTPGSEHDPDVFSGETYDPATNPFERVTLTDVTFTVPPAVPIDQAASQVALWHYDGGTTSVTTMSMAALAAAGPAALDDVVGVAVVYQSTDPASTGGLLPAGTANAIQMVLHTQLRPQFRSTGADMTGELSIDNDVLAQSFDPILAPDAQPNASAEAAVTTAAAGLDVTAAKTIAPDTLVETAPDVPVVVTLGATDGTSTLAAETVTLSDADTDFWAAFALVTLDSVELPAGADQVRVDLSTDGGATWTPGPTGPVAVLPPGIADLATVTGIRFEFSRADGDPFSNTVPAAGWSAEAVFTTELRDGIEFPSTAPFANTVATTATHAGYGPATAQATDEISLSSGDSSIDVRKDAPAGKLMTPGESAPWTLRFTNSGSAYIDVLDVLDDLGPWLRYAGGTPVYTCTNAGDPCAEMPTTAAAAQGDPGGVYVHQGDAYHITFEFPPGSRLAPGDTYTITVDTFLAPGLATGQHAVNSFRVVTGETFGDAGDCTNTTGDQGVLPWAADDPGSVPIDPVPAGWEGPTEIPGLADNECGTSNWVAPRGGLLLFSEKDVRGEVSGTLVDGAGDVGTGVPCTGEPGGFFRAACVAYTTIGATDEWRIGAWNTGTFPYRQVTLVDVLPRPGDRLLFGTGSRGSMWRPVFDIDFGVQVTLAPGATPFPAGTTTTVEVTTAADPCTGAGPSAWSTDPTCASHPGAAEWVPLASFPAADAAAITAVRVRLDFTTAAAGELAPGGAAHFVYRTVNVPRAGTEPTPEAIPGERWTGPTRVAWNQLGAYAERRSDGAPISVATPTSGVQLFTGSLEVTKLATGAATEFAAPEVTFDVTCTVPDGAGGVAAVDLGVAAPLNPDGQLVVPTGTTVQLGGLPLGATCDVTESGDVGAFGEVARVPDGTAATQTVIVDEQNSTAGATPADQRLTFTNRYDFGTVTVAKQVIAQVVPPVQFGPWDFSIACTTAFPVDQVVFTDEFTLATADDVYALTLADEVPANATCTLTEVTEAPATSIVVDGQPDADLDGDPRTTTLTLGAASDVTFVNQYPVGTLAVTKSRVGDGAQRYGAGPFELRATCTYAGVEIFTGAVTLTASNGYAATFDSGAAPAQLPAGASCTVAETSTGGATATPVFSPAPTVTIVGGQPGAAPPAEPTRIEVVNRFDVGTIAVVKVIAGAGAAAFGTGPFVVRVECSYDVDGQATAVAWGAETHIDVELTPDNGYRAVVGELPVGAECAAVAETVTGGATTIAFGAAAVVPAPGQPPAELTVTNTFMAGDLVVRKERVGNQIDRNGGGGPFNAEISCTQSIDGTIVPVRIPGGAVVTLSADTGFEARVSPLPLGATCTVVETNSGGADEVTYRPAGGVVTITAAPDTATVTIVNRFGELGASPVPPAPPVPGPSGRLPSTGSDVRRVIAVAGVLVALGTVLLTTRRSRRARA